MNVIILGPQGSGKGTQAEKIAESFGLEHIDMGKFLREVAQLPTELGKEINEIINVKKELVSDRILKKVLQVKLQDLPREKGIVFDGVPRSQNQLEYFEEALRQSGRKIEAVFFLDLSFEESLQRISKRRICEKCKKIFILGKDIKNENEPCPVCGGKIIQRVDDSLEGVKKRLNIFQKETMPILDYYKKNGVLIEINGNQSVEKVFADIEKKLKKLI